MDLHKQCIGVLMGGWGGERAVSLDSGRNVLAALQAKGYNAVGLDVAEPDALLPALGGIGVVFNCLHGGVGEDGTLQALLELLRLPYTGSGVLACALAMDKVRAKALFTEAGLSTPAFTEGKDPDAEGFEAWCRDTAARLGTPLVVKPWREGSSLGVTLVDAASGLAAACRAVAARYGDYFVEAFVPGVEVTAGVLCEEGANRALPLLELRPKRGFYDYEAKYTPGMTTFVVPAELDAQVSALTQTAAVAAHEALGCAGYSRVDFRITPQGVPFVLEVNTSPGMTDTSDLPQVAAAAGIPFADLVDRMLQTALNGKKEKGLAVPSPLHA